MESAEMKKVQRLSVNPPAPLSFGDIAAKTERLAKLRLMNLGDLELENKPLVLVEDLAENEIKVHIFPAGESESILSYHGPADRIQDQRVVLYRYTQEGWTHYLYV